MATVVIMLSFAVAAVPAFTDSAVAFGITEPFMDATLSATVSGTIEVIDIKEGEFVKKGESILKLERRLESLETERKRLVAESTIEIESAKSQVETIKENLEGTRQLFEETQSVSKEELQKKELEFKLAQAELDRLVVVEKLEAIEHNIAIAQLEKRIIRAPFSGIITKHFLEIGENCSPQQPLVRIVDISKVRLISYVEAGVRVNLKKGMSVTVQIDSTSSAGSYQGVIEFVSPVIDPSSGLREVKVLFENRDGKVKPGITAKMVIK